jgi:hypothetical protein
MRDSYIVWNGAMPTTAALTPVTTGTAIKTMLQIVPALPITIVEWGVSFNGTAANTPGVVELIDTGTVAATVTAYATADVMTYGSASSAANTSGSSGTPLNLGTALSGYTASAEGSTTATRLLGGGQIAPTTQYEKPLPLQREATVPTGHVLRVRMTFGTAVSALCYVIFEI